MQSMQEYTGTLRRVESFLHEQYWRRERSVHVILLYTSQCVRSCLIFQHICPCNSGHSFDVNSKAMYGPFYMFVCGITVCQLFSFKNGIREIVNFY